MPGHRFAAEVVADWVRASCAAQGLPVLVTDPGVLSVVAVLLTGRAAPGGPQRFCAGPPGRPTGSEPPHGLDPVRVHAPGPGGSGSDDDVIDHGTHDLGLAG